MFFTGDSALGWRYNFKKFPGEILQGLTDNIPLCCCLYYTFIKTVCLLVHALRNPRFIFSGFRTWAKSNTRETVDAMIFIMFTDLYRLENRPGWVFSPSFAKLDYWRCPICRIVDRREKLDWETGSLWDYSYYRCKKDMNADLRDSETLKY